MPLPKQPELDNMPFPLAMRVDKIAGDMGAPHFTDELPKVGDTREAPNLELECVGIAITRKDSREIHTVKWAVVK